MSKTVWQPSRNNGFAGYDDSLICDYFFIFDGYNAFPYIKTAISTVLQVLHWGLLPMRGKERCVEFAEKNKMTRLSPMISLTVFFLLVSVQAFAASPYVEPEGMFAAMQRFSQRMGLGGQGRFASPTSARPFQARLAMSGESAGKAVEGFFRPAPYQEAYPQLTYSRSHGGYVVPPGPDPNIAYPTDIEFQGAVPVQRIVYIPYAAPPPIHVERFGKAMRPPIMRWTLGDAYMQEYPEMPIRTYTTRGPRDFLAPNPPSIGY